MVRGRPLQAEQEHTTHTLEVLPWVIPFFLLKGTYGKESTPPTQRGRIPESRDPADEELGESTRSRWQGSIGPQARLTLLVMT